MEKKTQDAGYLAALGGAKKIIKVLVYVFIISAIILLGKISYDFGYDIFKQEATDTEANAAEVTVTITEEMSVYQIGKLLESKGLIERPSVFWFQEKLSDHHDMLVPGTYTLSTAQTADEILEVLSNTQTSEEGESEP